jgi:hypothetical protein
MFAMYSTVTGLISSTINRVPVDKAQLTALAVAGYAYVEVPDDVNGGNAVIDLNTKTYIKFEAAPPPVPNILVQYVAAQINAGLLSADAFHPVTRAEMNAQLSTANMATVAQIDATESTTGEADKVG